MSADDLATVEAMRRFGGSFVSTLAVLALHADEFNLARIKAAWPEYWAEYTHMARLAAGDGR